MAKYAVGYMNFFDNDLKVDIIEAGNWKEALSKHSSLAKYTFEESVGFLSDDFETAKDEAIDVDFLFDIVEIK